MTASGTNERGEIIPVFHVNEVNLPLLRGTGGGIKEDPASTAVVKSTMAALRLMPPLPESGDMKLIEVDWNFVPGHKPVFPEYSTEEARLKSFEDSAFESDKTVEELAANGFFFKGVRCNMRTYVTDICKCWWCGVLIACWLPEDDVMKEHLKGRPDCVFIRSRLPGSAVLPEEEVKFMLETRWSKVSICERLMQFGLSHEHLFVGLKEIYYKGLPFPEYMSDLLAIVTTAVDNKLKDSAADEGMIKCSSCPNQAIILFSPCCHLTSCSGCSRSLSHCDECGAAVSGRIVARIS